MTVCESCGRKTVDGKRLCPECLEASAQATTSFVPVGRPVKVPATEHPPGAEIYLRVVKGPQVDERFYLEGERITIGRDPKAQLFLNDRTVSREHAVIERDGSKITLRDAGSLNGTYLNGLIIEEALLAEDDLLQIGTFQLAFCRGSAS